MENLFDEYFSYDSRKDLEQFNKIPSETWMKIGEQKALENFQTASRAVPAYQNFLQKNKVDPNSIKTIEDFRKIPLTTKDNYFRKYPLKDLVMGGDLSKATVIHSSSGSTGKPLYWPKSAIGDINSYKGVELLYVYYFDIDKVNTLLINCFAMGPWAAGEIVHTSGKVIAEKGLKLTVVSPGLNLDLFFSFFENLKDNFDQIVVGGYTSFIKDIIEEAKTRNINLKQNNIKILTGGERFTENWRSYLSENLGFKNPHKSIASVLGTSETGVTSISTPFCDELRIFLDKNGDKVKNLFSRVELPSITQYVPAARHIEILENEIVVTCPGFVPLIRYNTQDAGEIFSVNEILEKLPNVFIEKFNSYKEQYGIPNLPVLTIYGRSDGTLTFYALNIFPEHINMIVESEKLKRYLSGKVIVEKLESTKSDPYLKVIAELNKNISPNKDLEFQMREIFAEELAKLNIEYKHLLESYGNKVKPIIELTSYNSNNLLFRSGKKLQIRN